MRFRRELSILAVRSTRGETVFYPLTENRHKNGILVTSSDQSEELIYEITKALWNKTTRKLLDNGHAKGKVIRLETALKGVEGLKVPLHPGAEKFYKEAGLL